MDINVKYFVIHHSGVDIKDNNKQFNSVRNYHIRRGWRDIGYHFFIENDGLVENGRKVGTIGAHCIGKNYNSIGICLAGNFNNSTPSKAQIDSLRDLISKVKVLYPKAKIGGHKQYWATSCPGKNFSDNVINSLVDDSINYDLMKRFEGKYIQRVKKNGEVYRIESGKLLYLKATRSDLFDDWSRKLQKDGDLIGITEEIWGKVKNALI